MDSDMIDAMLAAGATAEVIAAAWKVDLANRQKQLEERRASDRERQRRHRESHNVTVTNADSSDTPTPAPSFPPDPLSNPTPAPVCVSRARGDFPAPEGVSAEQWRAFRKQRKKPINDRSYVLLSNKLRELAEDGFPPGVMIDLAIERGWETVFKPKQDCLDGRPQPALRRTRTNLSDILRATDAGSPYYEDRDGAWPSLPAPGYG